MAVARARSLLGGARKAEARLAHLAYHDALTGLPNRVALAERLQTALRRADGSGRVVLLSIDLDDFKLVNDGLGHAAGDELLRQLAGRLESVRRPFDVLARQGGDEFVMLVELPTGADGAAAAATIAARVSDLLEAPFTVAAAEFRIGASIGAAVYPDDALDAESLHRHADFAMYEAKEAGGGFAAFRSGRRDPLARLSMAAALRRGIETGELWVDYQPVWRLPERTLIGLEALARWRRPGHGLVGPDEFIPVAEKTGVIDELGDWLLAQVCADAVAWDRLGLHPNIGVNVSPRQLQRLGFAEAFATTVARYGLAPPRIVIELTESGWTLEASRTMPALDELTRAGFVLALDDFGAGYSSLSRLRRLPVKIIKVDRSFMTDLPEDRQALAIVDGILGLANACRCDVVAEGVETEAQIQLLSGRGVRLAQGFGLARPQPAQAITALMRDHLVAGRRRVAA
ncbi:MAG: putative bifunctional diguanylate cyclase/phosphodiesterase [Solirubrobacteraceae bacterium]